MNRTLRFAIFVFLTALLCNANASVNTISVSNVQEFLAALGSDRTILLQPGNYDLSQADTTSGPNYRWKCGFGMQSLHVRDLHNLSIQSAGRMHATILATTAYGDAIVFERCNKVTLKDLKFARSERKPDCQGGSLRFVACNEVQMHNLKIRSERLGGVALMQCINIRAEKLLVEHAYESALEIKDCNLVMFAYCKFGVNAGHALLHITSSNTIQFHSCVFMTNVTPSDSLPSHLFYVEASKDVGVFGGVLMNNEADYLSNSSLAPSFDRVQFKDDNHWRRGKFAQ